MVQETYWLAAVTFLEPTEHSLPHFSVTLKLLFTWHSLGLHKSVLIFLFECYTKGIAAQLNLLVQSLLLIYYIYFGVHLINIKEKENGG